MKEYSLNKIENWLDHSPVHQNQAEQIIRDNKNFRTKQFMFLFSEKILQNGNNWIYNPGT